MSKPSLHPLVPGVALLLPILVSLLAGCASLKHPVAVDWQNGAKRGTVTRTFDASTPVELLPACLKSLPRDELAAHRYVEVEAMHRRHAYRDAGQLPAGVIAGPGDAVEIYTKNCQAGSLSTISRLLPLAPPAP